MLGSIFTVWFSHHPHLLLHLWGDSSQTSCLVASVPFVLYFHSLTSHHVSKWSPPEFSSNPVPPARSSSAASSSKSFASVTVSKPSQQVSLASCKSSLHSCCSVINHPNTGLHPLHPAWTTFLTALDTICCFGCWTISNVVHLHHLLLQSMLLHIMETVCSLLSSHFSTSYFFLKTESKCLIRFPNLNIDACSDAVISREVPKDSSPQKSLACADEGLLFRQLSLCAHHWPDNIRAPYWPRLSTFVPAGNILSQSWSSKT